MCSELQKLSGTVDPDSYASRLLKDDPKNSDIEYYLKLNRCIPGFDIQQDKLTKSPQNEPSEQKNDFEVGYYSFLAECEALHLIGDTLKLKIVGLNQVSARVENPKLYTKKNKDPDCDIVAEKNGKNIYFEVKKRSAEEKQIPPNALVKIIKEFKQGSSEFTATPHWCNRTDNFREDDEQLLKIAIDSHIKRFQESRNKCRNKPLPLYWPLIAEVERSKAEIIIYFNIKRDQVNYSFHFAKGENQLDYLSYLFGEGKIGSDGKPMKPMSQLAEAKGADCLMCRVEDSHDLKQLFTEFQSEEHYKQEPDRVFITDDSRLRTLTGIILYCSWKQYFIIRNSRVQKALI